MDEKYTMNFLIVFGIYLAVLIIFLFGFFIRSLSLNLWSDSGYYIIIAASFLPFIAALLYSKSSRFTFLWGKERFLRFIVMILSMISIAMNAIFVFPLI